MKNQSRNKNLGSITLVSFLLAALASPLALAGGYGAAGCGLGSQIFKKNSFVSQTFAFSTNHYFGMSSSITSGTSGCDAKGFVQNDASGQVLYAEQNYDSLTEEMASGRGEHLDAFAQVMGCGAEPGVRAFEDMAKAKFSELVPTARVTAVELVVSVRAAMLADSLVQANCRSQAAAAPAVVAFAR